MSVQDIVIFVLCIFLFVVVPVCFMIAYYAEETCPRNLNKKGKEKPHEFEKKRIERLGGSWDKFIIFSECKYCSTEEKNIIERVDLMRMGLSDYEIDSIKYIKWFD